MSAQQAKLYTIDKALHSCGHYAEARFYCYESQLDKAIENTEKTLVCSECRVKSDANS